MQNPEALKYKDSTEFSKNPFYPGGNELTSTRSEASFSVSSLAAWSGERGSAMRPVRVDSRMPKSEISLRKESIRDGFADLDGGCEENDELNVYIQNGGKREEVEKTYISTMQLLVLMSKTLPPN